MRKLTNEEKEWYNKIIKDSKQMNIDDYLKNKKGDAKHDTKIQIDLHR